MTIKRKWTRSDLPRHVVMCIASLVMLYPLLWLFASSFKQQDEIFGSLSLLPSAPDFNAYVRGWSGLPVSFGRFFLNSATIAVLSVIGNVISCSLAAYAFARLRFPGRNMFFTLMLGTMMSSWPFTTRTGCLIFFNWP